MTAIHAAYLASLTKRGWRLEGSTLVWAHPLGGFRLPLTKDEAGELQADDRQAGLLAMNQTELRVTVIEGFLIQAAQGPKIVVPTGGIA